jgi:hypothetical protein
MRLIEKTERIFEACDGARFANEKECHEYEMEIARSEVGKSSKYVIGTIFNDGTGYFQRYKKIQWKNGNVKYCALGGTTNVKYAYKFDSFEEAYNKGGDRVLTLEEAQKASDLSQSKKKKVDEREQRYVKVFTSEHTPDKVGEYITDRGLVEFAVDGWPVYPEPIFWMKKINKTAK